jgi:hypothetical protein
VGPRAELGAVQKRKIIFPLPRIELRFLGDPASNVSEDPAALKMEDAGNLHGVTYRKTVAFIFIRRVDPLNADLFE